MNSIVFLLFQWLPLLLVSLVVPSSVTATSINIPRMLIPFRKIGNSGIPVDFEPFSYTQTLDHFNFRPESYNTFKQRYFINSKYWGGPNSSAPIFAYFGAEEAIDEDLTTAGFLTDNASKFKALLLYIEHRYYGQSNPFSLIEENDGSTLGYLNSAQALADYAKIIMYAKRTYNSEDSPVIVVGGSYGGMLAAWFRLKYPHIASGALASSAPILYFDDITPQDGYHSIVTQIFRDTSETCYQTIRDSWLAIDKMASQYGGLSMLSGRFQTCQGLEDSSELKNYLKLMYGYAAQYNGPPEYPVSTVCRAINGASFGTDILGKIFAGVVAYEGNDKSCYVNPTPSQADNAWTWQRCSELVIPVGITNNTMFQADPFNIDSLSERCKSWYNVQPRPHWVTTYYGGHDLKKTLKRFGSNIIFSNGLKDPWSSGGVRQNISDSIVATNTANGSHCLDLLAAKPSDPQWLTDYRGKVLDLIKQMIDREKKGDDGANKG
ncbi:uncharacterized protein LOC110673327 [Hevea brasiliensis]|uniref:uncharacterized protein LOC110673327 n=1 Tax=Hevea brasiliensis TaxID=3981 RepID=UPI0025EA3A9F|nr:uncharacterized protein LOC110673327 [Hevea brasiliensis]